MPELAWTDKKPTEPGVYVYCAAGSVGRRQRFIARVTVDDAGCLQVEGVDGDQWLMSQWANGFWLGPLSEIPETQEEDAQTAERS